MIHGQGCPVCLTPLAFIDEAILLAQQKNVVLCSFGDMLRVPGTETSLLEAKARGVDVFQSKIPMLSQVNSACELPGLDPIYVANEGVILAVVDKEIELLVIGKMNKSETGRSAAIIREITSSHPGKVVTHAVMGRKGCRYARWSIITQNMLKVRQN
jgi:hypothetical protein